MVPNVNSTLCKVYIAASALIYDFSPGVFTIWNPPVSTITPAPGQVTLNFGSTFISLSAFVVLADAITVKYNKYESPAPGLFPESILKASDYYWKITSPNITFINGFISAPLSAITGFNNQAKLVWLTRTNSGDPWINLGGNISNDSLVSLVSFSSLGEYTIGTTDTTTLVAKDNQVPSNYKLDQNYPNPFNPATQIKYYIPKDSKVRLKVYNSLGKLVVDLVNKMQTAGSYLVSYKPEFIPSGVYFYTLNANSLNGSKNFLETKKMILLK